MSEPYVQCPQCQEIFSVRPHLILTKRELEIIQLLATGVATSKIADALFVSVKTVESHRAHIYRKTETRNPAQLALWAVKHGLVTV